MTDLLAYIDHMGDDLRVANAARVSLAKWKIEFDDKDAGLIKFLIKSRPQHTSPLRHAVMTVRATVPLFVARQWFKHRVGVAIDDLDDFDAMEFNEASGRYIEFDETQAWEPPMWRKGSPSIKQGSLPDEIDNPWRADAVYQSAVGRAFESYQLLLGMGVCKEQARAVLPLATMTQFVCTASLQAWWHFYVLRSDSHAQAEIRVYAQAVGCLLERHFPVTWQVLQEYAR